MSVFLTLGLIDVITSPHGLGALGAIERFLREMGVGALLGLAGGWALLWLMRRTPMPRSAVPVLAFGAALAIFGGAEVAGASGFLAAYLAGAVVGNVDHPDADPVAAFFETLGWLAQNTLFLMLGLLVTPHRLSPLIVPALILTAVLMFVARPVGVLASLLPFRWSLREAAFVAWAGLRGGVPIYLTIIPLLAGVPDGRRLFQIVFVIVVVSVAVQGWTVAPFARLLRLRPASAD